MSLFVEPSEAARLAAGVYAVNENNPRSLKVFLGDKLLFSGNSAGTSSSKKVINAHVGGRMFRAAQDGFGVCSMGGGNYEGHAFLLFRGTTTANNKADFVTDARIGLTISKTGLPVHIGFNHTFNSMLPEIRDFLAKGDITGPVHCIGHSLGGAVASLAADWVSRNTSYQTRLYSFGAPRVGTDWFVNRTTDSIGPENMYRVYHKTDPVPMVAMYPFMQAPYGSPGYFIHSSELALSGAAHKMKKYTESVKNKSWEQVGDVPDQPYLFDSAVEDWLKSRNWASADSPVFWQWAEAALRYVLKKVIVVVAYSLQTTFVSVLTVADKLAIILEKGLHLAEHISLWVELLIRKLLRALGMKVEASKEAITRSLIRMVLVRLIEKGNRQARNALRNL